LRFINTLVVRQGGQLIQQTIAKTNKSRTPKYYQNEISATKCYCGKEKAVWNVMVAP
jgi:hypothetical protein